LQLELRSCFFSRADSGGPFRDPFVALQSNRLGAFPQKLKQHPETRRQLWVPYKKYLSSMTWRDERHQNILPVENR
jgi:hypothetical protein